MLRAVEIYLDNAATTKPDPVVLEAMAQFQDVAYHNASSLHKRSLDAMRGIEKARADIAGEINSRPGEIVFTSGGTEANNMAIKGVAFAKGKKGSHLITSRIEHPSVLEAMHWLESQGYRVTYLPVDEEGFVDPEDVRSSIDRRTILVSIMHANNEIGTIQNIEHIGRICRDKGVFFHSDACQSFVKTKLDVSVQNVDLLSLNAHKIHGPKGIGALYIREGVNIEPLLHGGGHENQLRSGTYNTPGIIGLGKAVEIADWQQIVRMRTTRNYFLNEIRERIDGVVLNGPTGENRLCTNLNFIFDGIEAKYLYSELKSQNIVVSTGSACSSNHLEASHVLLAIGLEPQLAHRALRFSLSKWTSRNEIDLVVDCLAEMVKKDGSFNHEPS